MASYIIKSSTTGEKPSYWVFGRTWTLDIPEATRFQSKRAAELHISDNKWHEQRQLLGHLEVLEYQRAVYLRRRTK